MKAMITVLVLLFLIVAAFVLFRKTSPPPPAVAETEAGGKDALAAASEMLEFLPVLADSRYFERLGFKTIEEVSRVELGRPIPYVYLRCDLVRAYDTSQGGDPMRLSFGDQLFYPLKVQGRARSAFLVDSLPDEKNRKDKEWTVVEFGKSNLAVLADSLIKNLSGQSGIPDSLFSLVEIPGMRLTYLAFPGQGGTYMHPIGEGICWPGKKGESARAEAVLSGLARCEELALACNEPVRHPPAEADGKAAAGDSPALKKGPAAK